MLSVLKYCSYHRNINDLTLMKGNKVLPTTVSEIIRFQTQLDSSEVSFYGILRNFKFSHTLLLPSSP